MSEQFIMLTNDQFMSWLLRRPREIIKISPIVSGDITISDYNLFGSSDKISISVSYMEQEQSMTEIEVDLRKNFSDITAEAIALRQRVKVLEDALKWYADVVENCNSTSRVGDTAINMLKEDIGRKAKQALTGEKGGE